MELIIPQGTQYISERQYEGDESIESLVLPEGLLGIDEEAFSGCAALRALSLPESLAELGAAAFCGCVSLGGVHLSSKLERIGDGAFLGCESLREISLPPSLREIGSMAFWGSGLESVSVPASVERIGDSAFWECASLCAADVLNPHAVLGEDIFGICYALTQGYIAPGYSENPQASDMLMYTLLWCSSYQRHSETVSRRAREYIAANEELIMERIFKYNNVPALTGLVSMGLLQPERMNEYVRTASSLSLTELTALLLEACGGENNTDWEFEL